MSAQKHYTNTISTPFYDHWKSTLLAKLEEYDIPLEPAQKGDFKAISAIIREHEKEQIELSKRAVVAAEDWIGEWEREMLSKAKKYKIPYNLNEIDWAYLEDTISEYETLLKQADERNVYWDINYFDMVGLAQELEYQERLDCESGRDLYRYYCSTRL